MFLPGEVRTAIEESLAETYALFERARAYIPSRTACTQCDGVDSIGEPVDPTCQYCDDGYVWTWTVQEFEARVADIALVTQLFVSITPGIAVGDKLLVFDEADAALVQAVRDNDEAYLEMDSRLWRPNSVQPSQVGRHWEWVAHLVKYTPEVAYGS